MENFVIYLVVMEIPFPLQNFLGIIDQYNFFDMGHKDKKKKDQNYPSNDRTLYFNHFYQNSLYFSQLFSI